jgi:hypothetical protein
MTVVTQVGLIGDATTFLNTIDKIANSHYSGMHIVYKIGDNYFKFSEFKKGDTPNLLLKIGDESVLIRDYIKDPVNKQNKLKKHFIYFIQTDKKAYNQPAPNTFSIHPDNYQHIKTIMTIINDDRHFKIKETEDYKQKYEELLKLYNILKETHSRRLKMFKDTKHNNNEAIAYIIGQMQTLQSINNKYSF